MSSKPSPSPKVKPSPNPKVSKTFNPKSHKREFDVHADNNCGGTPSSNIQEDIISRMPRAPSTPTPVDLRFISSIKKALKIVVPLGDSSNTDKAGQKKEQTPFKSETAATADGYQPCSSDSPIIDGSASNTTTPLSRLSSLALLRNYGETPDADKVTERDEERSESPLSEAFLELQSFAGMSVDKLAAELPQIADCLAVCEHALLDAAALVTEVDDAAALKIQAPSKTASPTSPVVENAAALKIQARSKTASPISPVVENAADVIMHL